MNNLDIKCNCINCNKTTFLETHLNKPLTQPFSDEFFDVNKRYEHHVNTSDLYRTLNLPDRFEHSYIFNGYGNQRKGYHPVYRTTNSEYGWMPPSAHTVPLSYYPRSNEFSSVLAKCGMYRNYSLNTGLDK